MTERKTLKIKPKTKDRLNEHKREGETFDGLLLRAMDALEDEGDDLRTILREELGGE
jgi:hypothetical protein